MSSIESDVLGFFIPNCVLCYIFSSYLLLEDISHFDIAICNKNRRPHFLEYIGSKLCVWRGHFEKSSSGNEICWLSNRSINQYKLRFSQVTYDTVIKIASIRYNVHTLLIQENDISAMSIAIILKAVTNLEFLDLDDCKNVNDTSISWFLKNG